MSAQPPNRLEYATPGYTPPKRFGRGLFGWVLFIGLAVMLFLLLQNKRTASPEIPVSEVFRQLRQNNVAEIVVDGDALRVRLSRPTTAPTLAGPTTIVRAELPPGMSQNWAFLETLIQHPVRPVVRVENNQSLLLNILVPVIPWLLIFAFIWFFVFRQLRNRPAAPVATPVYMVHPPEQK